VRAIVPTVPAAVAELVAKALARDRASRFASAAQMLVAVHEVAPAERTRVPIEAADMKALAATLAATIPATSGVPTAVTWANSGREASEPPRVRAPSRFALPLTAFAATLMGVGVTLWILSMMRGNAAENAAVAGQETAPTVTVSAAPTSIPARNEEPAERVGASAASALPQSVHAPSPPAKATARATSRGSQGATQGTQATAPQAPQAAAQAGAQATAKPALPASPSTDLDLQRDLP